MIYRMMDGWMDLARAPREEIRHSREYYIRFRDKEGDNGLACFFLAKVLSVLLLSRRSSCH